MICAPKVHSTSANPTMPTPDVFRLSPLRSVLITACLLVGGCSDDKSTLPSDFRSATELQQEARDLDERPNIVVVFTDDQGYADLGAHGILGDVITPHIDALAAEGALMSSGYVTAPQCTPSRAGLMTGRYQQRFGLDDNRYTPMPLSETTLATRLQEAGYATGMVGKWHLEVDQNSQDYDVDLISSAEKQTFFPEQRGFDDVYFGYRNSWWTNFDLEGNTLSIGRRRNENYRLDVSTDAGIAFIERHKEAPFFLYLAYFAPHVPLEATEKYLSRFEGAAETRRKYGLAMMSAIDDGVGRIQERLAAHNLTDNTLVFFISDNGAPLGIHKLDLPIDNNGGAWDGSLNDPMNGEKGMLSEGGIRVPYVVSWPGKIPTGLIMDTPVTTLDVAATSLSVAGIAPSQDLDGADLLPLLTGTSSDLEERSLYWRFWNQSAIRKGRWKYLKAGSDYEFLFNMDTGATEQENLISAHPFIAAELKQDLENWTGELQRPNPVDATLNVQEVGWYNHYFPNP